MRTEAEGLAVHHRLVVAAPPERAFAVFTAGFATWWPLATHHIGAQPPVDATIEPRSGGRCFERAADGTECQWGRVLVWEPPDRIVLSWEIDAQWRPDPAFASEVEVRFRPLDDGRTEVELEHRKLEVYGEDAARLRDAFDSPGGWRGVLAGYAAALDTDA